MEALEVFRSRKNQYFSNNFDKPLIVLETPEDIAKWREERKANFPTKENIAKRIADQKDKVKCVKKVQKHSKHFQKNSNFCRNNQFSLKEMKRKMERKQKNNFRKKSCVINNNYQIENSPVSLITDSKARLIEEIENKEKVTIFQKSFKQELEEGEIEDSNDNESVEVTRCSDGKMSGSLALLSTYDSSDDDQDSTEKVVKPCLPDIVSNCAILIEREENPISAADLEKPSAVHIAKSPPRNEHDNVNSIKNAHVPNGAGRQFPKKRFNKSKKAKSCQNKQKLSLPRQRKLTLFEKVSR